MFATNSASRMDWERYHDLEEIYDYLHRVEQVHHKVARVYDIGSSYEKRPMKVLGLHLAGKGEKVSGRMLEGEKWKGREYCDPPPEVRNVFFEGGLHAREWISVAATTYIIRDGMTKRPRGPKLTEKMPRMS